MTPEELRAIGAAFLPDHSADRWYKEIARIARRTERMVRMWASNPEEHPVPPLIQDVLRAAYRKQTKSRK